MASIQSHLHRFLIGKLINFNKSLVEIKKEFENRNSRFLPPRDVAVKQVTAGGVNAEWFVPRYSTEDKVLVYLHGGGYCLGLSSITRKFVARISLESGLRTLLVDYRLAPKHPWPAALDDAVNVYNWLQQEGYSPRRIAFAGDSSGAGLCLSALLEFRNGGLPLPSSCAALCPVLDMAGTGESFKTRAHLDPFRLKDPLGIAKHSFTNTNPKDPILSPLYSNLHGLPPLLIHAAQYDVFEDDAVRFAQKAEAAGANVTLTVWEKMWHIFQLSPQFLPEANQARSEISAFIQRYTK
ncbi:MAG: alpha/beta hydrolase [Deltaproteobacteria bacterium]|nr:alpha/beta hydrolase [Deltaproteobacteria bacterium]